MNRVLKVAMSGLPSLLQQSLQRVDCAQTQWASFVCALNRARFLKPYQVLAAKLNHGCFSLVTLFEAACADPMAQRGCRRQPKVETCGFGQLKSLLLTRASWSRWRKDSVLSSLQWPYYTLEQKLSKYSASETLGAALSASEYCFSSF